MLRRQFFAACLAVLAAPALAEEDGAPVAIQLTAAQIQTLLEGNTVVGTWSGSGYKQFYGEGGFTMYVPDDGGNDQGMWRTNAETDQYESWWRMTGWTPYTVMMTNDGYAWVNGETLEPFQVFEGKQVSW